MSEFEISGTFKVIFEDEDMDNAIMECMDNYLSALNEDCDDWFKSVEFELINCNELKE